MTIQPITTSRSYTADRAWLASLHGTDQTETITLDIAKFTKDTHWVASTDTHQQYSRVLSGVPVGKISASGLYGPYDPAAADGRQTLAGCRVRRGPVRADRDEGPSGAAVARRHQGRERARRHRPHQGDPVLHGRPDPVRVRRN